MPMKCGLLGEKLGHSRSPEIHARLGDYEYKLYEKAPADVEDFLLHGDYDVINVTIPYKKTAFVLCRETSATAAELGNVNVVVKKFDGSLYGDNTDARGFAKLVETVGTDVRGKKCVVLGSGGAAQTAAAVLRRLGAGETVNISRSGENNYSNLARHADAAVIVNATPVGMYPRCDEQPVELSDFPRCEAVIDLIYNPSPTRLLAEAARRGIPGIGGELMLEEQAKLASAYMNANLWLYGPPGCGKSTFGRKLAAAKKMPFIDLDAEIEKRAGRKISQIFAAEGEGPFREMEKAELLRVSSGRGQVVALGGGALLDEECRSLTESTGRVVFIECAEEELVRRTMLSSDRPLLVGDVQARMRQLLAARQEHYNSFSERIKFLACF
jgi:shikimate dehydrogenase